MAKIRITEEKLTSLIEESIYELLQEAQYDEGFGHWLGNSFQKLKNKWNNFKGDIRAGRNKARYDNRDYDSYSDYGDEANQLRNFDGGNYARYRYDLATDRNRNANQFWVTPTGRRVDSRFAGYNSGTNTVPNDAPNVTPNAAPNTAPNTSQNTTTNYTSNSGPTPNPNTVSVPNQNASANGRTTRTNTTNTGGTGVNQANAWKKKDRNLAQRQYNQKNVANSKQNAGNVFMRHNKEIRDRGENGQWKFSRGQMGNPNAKSGWYFDKGDGNRYYASDSDNQDIRKANADYMSNDSKLGAMRENKKRLQQIVNESVNKTLKKYFNK